MNYKIWNKVEPINGVLAEQVIKDLSIKQQDDIFLIMDEYNVVSNIEFAKTIQSRYKMNSEMTVDEIAQEYIRTLEEKEEERVAEEEQKEKDAQDKISILSEQNTKLLLDSEIKTNDINALNKNAANLTLEIAKMKGGM